MEQKTLKAWIATDEDGHTNFFENNIGFLICLFILHKFKKQLNIDNYDNEKSWADYEDYDSNAEAFTVWSMMWPVILIVGLCVITWKFLLWLSKKIENKL